RVVASGSLKVFNGGCFSTGDDILLLRLPNRYTQSVNKSSFGDLNLRDLTEPCQILWGNIFVGQDEVAILDAAKPVGGLGSDLAAVDDQNPSLAGLQEFALCVRIVHHDAPGEGNCGSAKDDRVRVDGSQAFADCVADQVVTARTIDAARKLDPDIFSRGQLLQNRQRKGEDDDVSSSAQLPGYVESGCS